MQLNLKFIETSEFNSEDLYFFYDKGIKLLFISRVEKSDNGSWFTTYGLQYKATSLVAQNCKELYHKEISLKDLDYKGIVTKFQEPHKTGSVSSIGINWYGGTQVKQNGLANYWTDLEKLNLKY